MKVVYHADYLKQTQNRGHPECPERLEAIMHYLDSHDIRPEIVTPEPADIADVTAVHSAEYLELLRNFGRGRLDADTAVLPHTYEIAMLSAGGAVAAAKAMLDHNAPAFALVRPPGHHATAGMGMGFCYINNVAVAASWLRKKLDKVAIVDIDVHHGNGTNDMFVERSDVLYISTHQWGIYPGTGLAVQTGAGEGKGFTVNIPMGAQSGDATFEAATDKLIIPILEQYGPDAILISLGGDAHYLDPLSSLNLSSKGYVDMLSRIAELASKRCDGRWAAFLEGGYNVAALADVVGPAIAMAASQEFQTRFNEVSDADVIGAEWVSQAKAIQSKHWKL